MTGMLKFFRQCLFVCFVFLALATNAHASEKKGVGYSDLRDPGRIAALNVSWYYTWNSRPIEGVPAEKFVPMLRSRGGDMAKLERQIDYLKSRGKVPTLLVFNEPDRKSGDNMSVEQVINSWPEIVPLADQISSPSAAAVMGPWFDKFYRAAQEKNIKFDFLSVHLFVPPDPDAFLKQVDAIYEKYHLPIWITAFNVADKDAAPWRCKIDCKDRYTEEQVLAFMKAVLPELEKRKYVVRYAWFGVGKYTLSHEYERTSGLFDKDGNLTALGKYYASFE